MITEQQVYAQFDSAMKLAGRFNVLGYDTHDLASEALLHLLNRSKQANVSKTVIADFTHWATRVMRRKIIDLRRGTLLTSHSTVIMQLPRYFTEGAGQKERGFSHDDQSGERDALHDSATENEPHFTNQVRGENGHSSIQNTPSREKNPLTTLTDAEERKLLLDSIQQLAGPYRRTAELMIGGVSDEDGATVLGITLAAYQMRKCRVIQQLREIMVKD